MKPEIEPSTFSVFGITICSRYGVLWEITEMIDFLRDAQKEGLTEPIEELFYDSNNSYLTFTFRDGYKDIEKHHNHPILRIALKHISQFVWDGDMKHSPSMEQCEFESRD